MSSVSQCNAWHWTDIKITWISVCQSMCLCVCPNSKIPIVHHSDHSFCPVFLDLECRLHIWQPRLKSMTNNTGSSNAHARQFTSGLAHFYRLVFTIVFPFLVRFLSNLVSRFIWPTKRTGTSDDATGSDLRACA